MHGLSRLHSLSDVDDRLVPLVGVGVGVRGRLPCAKYVADDCAGLCGVVGQNFVSLPFIMPYCSGWTELLLYGQSF